MGLATDMNNLSEEIVSSFKQRIKLNEELVSEVQNTLDGFHKDHQEMAAVLNANATALRVKLDKDEKNRLNIYKDLMTGIHNDITSIQNEISNLLKGFSEAREQMADELNKFFAQGKADRQKNEKTRLKEFDTLMKNINDEIKSINEEVLSIFKNTNDMLEKFDKEHLEMSAELIAELSKNMAERVEYSKSMLQGFQKSLSEIGKENQKMAQKLRKDLANGEVERLKEYNVMLKGIRTEVKGIQKAIAGLLSDFSQDRGLASAEWNKMQDAIAQLKKTGVVTPSKEVIRKAEKKEAKKEIPVKEGTIFSSFLKKFEPEVAMTLEQKVLNYINKHPKGVKVAEMEEPLGETRMKLGFTTKNLLDEGKVRKVENIYYPI